MNKKLVEAICFSILIISAGICTLGYVLGNSGNPWWLTIVAGGIACVIISMVGGITREKDQEKKSKGLISCICASISMISVLIFLVLLMTTEFTHSWIVIFIGGIASGVTYAIYNATKKENEEK